MADTDDPQSTDICRVCRCEATSDNPLFHPCICTGSIKWIHQDCLTQWMKYSRKGYCELCRYQFNFMPIYDENMPRHLPLRDVVFGLVTIVVNILEFALHYTAVAGAWLGIVPLVACRISRFLFNFSFDSMNNFSELFSVNNLASDMFQGSFIVTCTLFGFIGLVWLREQIMHGGGPVWLDPPDVIQQGAVVQVPEDAPDAAEVQDEEEEEEENDDEDDNPENGDNIPVVDDHNNWNPVEWDRGEELTWERLLGLDGSLIFLEHVFWVLSLNTIFLMIFAFLPYHIGNLLLMISGTNDYVKSARFEGLMTTFAGYMFISFMFVVFHGVTKFAKLVKLSHVFGICYIILKVSLLLLIEIGVLPIICGWWLDICSLSMFNTTLRDRTASFNGAPGTNIFIRWFIGMVFIYYFVSFVLVLREVLRPSVLWFLRNINDPDFSPIQEMIHMPMHNHVRRLMITSVIFGMIIMLLVYVPSRILKVVCPSFLPYVVTSHSESLDELSVELLLLEVILPALLEQHYLRQWIRYLIRVWCKSVAWCLNIKSYLLGDDEEEIKNMDVGGRDDGEEHVQLIQDIEVNNADEPAAADDHVPLVEDVNVDVMAANVDVAPPVEPVEPAEPIQPEPAPLPNVQPIDAEPPSTNSSYIRPNYFPLRIVLLLIFLCMSLVMLSLIVLTLPVYIGRTIMSVGPTLLLLKPAPVVHESYTASAGLYVLWLMIRLSVALVNWLPRGKTAVLQRLATIGKVAVKSIIAAVWLGGVIPLMFGLLVELVFVVPLRVPLEQTPVLWPWLDWGLGLLYMKICCALLLMGPDCQLKRALERLVRNGFQRMDLYLTMVEVVIPLVSVLGIFLAYPYFIAHGFVPLIVKDFKTRNIVSRRIYPYLLLIMLLGSAIAIGASQFLRWYQHIRDAKYLVGRKLINYNHKKKADTITALMSTSKINPPEVEP